MDSWDYVTELAALNHADLNRDLNQMIFLKITHLNQFFNKHKYLKKYFVPEQFKSLELTISIKMNDLNTPR